MIILETMKFVKNNLNDCLKKIKKISLKIKKKNIKIKIKIFFPFFFNKLISANRKLHVVY